MEVALTLLHNVYRFSAHDARHLRALDLYVHTYCMYLQATVSKGAYFISCGLDLLLWHFCLLSFVEFCVKSRSERT